MPGLGRQLHQPPAPQRLHDDYRQTLFVGVQQPAPAGLAVLVQIVVLNLAEVPVIGVHQAAELFAAAVIGKADLPDLADALQNETAWNELEQRLSDRILQRIEDRIQFILEETIRQNLTDSIGKMTGTLVSEIKNDLQSTLDVVVTHAVTDELHRLRQKEFFSESNHLKITGKNGSSN